MVEPTSGVLFLDQSGVLGGAELSLLDIAATRVRGGVRDSVLLFDSGPFLSRLQECDVSAEVLPLDVEIGKQSGMSSHLLGARRVVTVARRVAQLAKNYSALYANTQKAAVVAVVAGALARKPVIWHLRDTLDACHFSKANRFVAVQAANWGICRVIANSLATAAAFNQAGGRAPTTVVYNGIATAPFKSAEEDTTTSTRASVGVPARACLLGVFGRLTEWKGQHVLLDALAESGNTDAHCLVVGDALFTGDDRQYATDLKAVSSEPPLAGRVHWLGHRDDIPSLMKACDVVVHCSTQPEPFGRVIVEGMLAGRPVIASAAGGAIEIIEDGVTGLLTPPGDAKALRAAIDRLLNDPGLANRLAEAGRESALRRFSLDDRVAEINAVIEEVVGEHRARSRKA